MANAVQEKSYLEMSDEEMMNAAPPVAVEAPVVEAAVEKVEEKQEAQVEEEADAEDKEPEEAPGTGAEEGDEEDEKKVEKEELKEDKQEASKATKEEKKPEVKEEAKVVDFEAEYKRLLAPFKANGTNVEVKSVDDAIELMQMGANYHKKMAALKPNMKLMKMLQNNGLLDEGKLSYLIDLDKKNPEAINKLVKESGLNPMDLDADKAGEYKPKIHAVDDREIDLDTVLDEIQSTPTYNRTLEIVGQKWDGPSKQVIAASPQLLKVINSHVQSGIYDLISKEMESQRVFGRLNGVSDIEAYRQIGDSLNAQGKFNHLGSSQGKPSAAGEVVVPKPKKVEDDALKDKRRAASSTKPVASTVVPADFNPLALSDDEFNKITTEKLR